MGNGQPSYSPTGAKGYRTIIAGSRCITNCLDLMDALDGCRFDISEVVSGGAEGADKLGERYAKDAGLKLTVVPADWKTYGKSAGPIRNRQMAEYAQALIALWDEESAGTRNMIEEARKRGLLVHVHLAPFEE